MIAFKKWLANSNALFFPSFCRSSLKTGINVDEILDSCSPYIDGNFRVDDICYQMDIFPTMLHLIDCGDYYWHGLGVNILDENARQNRGLIEQEAYRISDLMIRNDYFRKRMSKELWHRLLFGIIFRAIFLPLHGDQIARSRRGSGVPWFRDTAPPHPANTNCPLFISPETTVHLEG